MKPSLTFSRLRPVLALFGLAACGTASVRAELLPGQPPGLPDPLVRSDGTAVLRPEQWPARRAEILALFEEHVYGRTPVGRPDGMEVWERARHEGFLDGKAVLHDFRVQFTADAEGPGMDLLVVRPAGSVAAPCFLGLNFGGNHRLHPFPEIPLPLSWMRDEPGLVAQNRATEAGRGERVRRWPLEMLVDAGFALASAYCGDIDPDFDDGFANGAHALHPPTAGAQRPADAWGTLGAWAWGLSRALDALEGMPEIDAKRVAVVGHSRLGKAALWAGAQDERFALVISNNSGCGGAALSRRVHGETIEAITRRFPHWFCRNFNRYANAEAECPVDQHQLLALIAPRPLYVASATEDDWADPLGEFLSARLTGPVYALHGMRGLGQDTPPEPDVSVGDRVGYHIRTGKHDILEADWRHYIAFAQRHFKELGSEKTP